MTTPFSFSAGTSTPSAASPPQQQYASPSPTTPFTTPSALRGTRTPGKRGRKPRAAGAGVGTGSPRMTPEAFSTQSSPLTTTPTSYSVHWAVPNPTTATGTSAAGGEAGGASNSNSPAPPTTTPTYVAANTALGGPTPPTSAYTPPTPIAAAGPPGTATIPASALANPSSLYTIGADASRGTLVGARSLGTLEEDVEGDDEWLPAMADDDYSAQASFQSQSKDNLKVLMDNFSPAQYERFEAYRRHALPKQAVRKVIQHTTGQQVSQPVAQIVAGFAKVFVGEIVEKAREVQARRGETGPLSPDHLREAYRMYQTETGRVGAARPVRSKRLFVR